MVSREINLPKVSSRCSVTKCLMNMRPVLALLLLACVLITCVQTKGRGRGGGGGGGGGGVGGGSLEWWWIFIIVFSVALAIFCCCFLLGACISNTEEAEVVEEGAGDKDATAEEIQLPSHCQNKPVQVQIDVKL